MENETFKPLEVGDVILSNYTNSRRWDKHKVFRVTPAFAFLNTANGTKLKRDMGECGDAVGSSASGGFSRTDYYRPTQRILEIAEKDKNLQYCIANQLDKIPTTNSEKPTPQKIARIVAIHKEAMAKIAAVLAESEVQNG